MNSVPPIPGFPPELAPLLEHFQLSDPVSIYPFAPVYRAQYGLQTVVLKQTRAMAAGAQAVQVWLQTLPSEQTVRALDLPMANPWPWQDEHWVLYPFVDGEAYRAEPEQIRSAGELLGLMHAQTESLGLPAYGWPLQEADSLDEDRAGLETLVEREGLSLDPCFWDWLDHHQELRQTLRQAPLPQAPGTWDYKANNLVYVSHQESPQAVLIDPDSAGFLPRILDLALAALLFHNELATAPPRLWLPDEWQIFLAGYTQFVSLTELEQQLWPQALQWMFLEEALWLLLNDLEATEGGWQEPHQAAFLRDLLKLPQRDWLFSLSGPRR